MAGDDTFAAPENAARRPVSLRPPPARLPAVRRITVLYDPDCPLCRSVSGWLAGQSTLIAVDLVPANSPRAHNRYPRLDHAGTLREITVVGGSGEVWTGAAAWLTVLWALRAYRGLSFRLATPVGMPMARGAVLAAARIRAVTAKDPGRTGDDDPYGAEWTTVVCDGGCELGAH